MANRSAAPIKAVLLDWDGTLLDSYRADSRSFLEMFHALGIDWGLAELEKHYSPNWHRIYRAARLPRSRWEEADRLWRRAYRRHQPELLSGARRVLRTLARRYVLGVVSSGSRRRVPRQLRRFGLARFFATCVCSEDAHCLKPNPAPLRLAMLHLRLPPAACVYVGDTPDDVEMARRAHVRAIGVLGPFPTARRLRAARPDALLRRIDQLPEALRKLSTGRKSS